MGSRYDTCPSCGRAKIKTSRTCNDCRLDRVRGSWPKCIDCGARCRTHGGRCRTCAGIAKRGVPAPKPAGWVASVTRARWDGRRATAENREQRFMALVNTSGECWDWLGGRSGKGGAYGKFEGTSAHRVAYELFVGEIPEGFEVDHLCVNAGCVNPAHLEAVTGHENRRRQHERSRHAARHRV
jgi:hypothetical protein